jgi:hypothetical protein
MRRIFIGICGAVLLWTAQVASAQTAGLLPDHFASWNAEGAGKTLTPKDLGSWTQSPDGESVLREAGLRKIEERSYRGDKGEVTLRVFEVQDPSSAYELYTFLETPATGATATAATGGEHFQLGNLVVTENGGVIEPDNLTALLAAMKPKAETGPLPPLKGYLPAHERVAGSEKYALGPDGFRAAVKALEHGELAGISPKDLGFNNGAEAILAEYRGARDHGVLLLLDYPTPQLAEQHLHHLEQALPQAAKDAGATIERKASVLSVTLAPSSAAFAQRLRDDINFETSVHWNEPHQTATDPPWAIVLSKIFLFTCVFMGVTTALGFAFGGVRVIVKRMYPGKVFDRPQDIEVLQLGLSGKKIDPSDLY